MTTPKRVEPEMGRAAEIRARYSAAISNKLKIQHSPTYYAVIASLADIPDLLEENDRLESELSDMQECRHVAEAHCEALQAELTDATSAAEMLRQAAERFKEAAINFAWELFERGTVFYTGQWRYIYHPNRTVEQAVSFLLGLGLIEKHPEQNWYRRIER